MSKKKNKRQPKTYESTQKPGDTFAMIYNSMLTHPSFKSLTASQKILYLYCKAQQYSEKQKPISSDESTFTMNRVKYSNYGLYSKNSGKSFQRDIDALIEHGLIDCVRSGKNLRRKSIYRFSDRWINWGKDWYRLPFEYMTTSLVTQYKGKNENRIDGNI